MLRQWDSGELRRNRNQAVVRAQHGRLINAAGDYMDIGGSTGGGFRRIILGWLPPEWTKFLQEGPVAERGAGGDARAVSAMVVVAAVMLLCGRGAPQPVGACGPLLIPPHSSEGETKHTK